MMDAYFTITETPLPPLPPPKVVRGIPVDEARQLLADHLLAIRHQVLDWHRVEYHFGPARQSR